MEDEANVTRALTVLFEIAEDTSLNPDVRVRAAAVVLSWRRDNPELSL